MGYKQLKSDVAAAAQSDLEVNVSDISRGDSEEEFVFTYFHRRLDSPLKFHAFVTDVSSYPSQHGFLIFTEAENFPSDLAPLIANLPACCHGKTACDFIHRVARSITAKLENTDDDEYSLGLSDDNDGDIVCHDYEDQDFGSDPEQRGGFLTSSANNLSEMTRKRLRQDFTSAIRAGIKPTLLGESSANCHSIFALPICVKALGVPADTLEAWDFTPTDHIILLMRLNGGYPTLQQFLNREGKSQYVQFRLGKCKTAKPSLATARLAFDESRDSASGSSTQSSSTSARTPESHSASDDFISTYVCTPINDLLSQHLPALVRLRRDQGLTWDQAQETLFRNERGSPPVASHLDNPGGTHGVITGNREPKISRSTSPGLQHDFALDSEEDFSLPVVAMQIALHRVSQCAEFCQVCHRKLRDGHEAVKPYVCEDTLCLHQYLNLGLGHTVEHEVIKHPYVVDLLVSFFAAAIYGNSRTKIPLALGIKAIDRTQRMTAMNDFNKKQVWSFSNSEIFNKSFRRGTRFVMVYGTPLGNINQFGLLQTAAFQALVCRVEDIEGERVRYRVMGSFRASPTADETSDGNIAMAPTPTSQSRSFKPSENQATDKPTTGTGSGSRREPSKEVEVWPLSKDIDEEGTCALDRKFSLMASLNCIPSVLEMRSFLKEKPGRRLSQWVRMDQATCTLLNWIVKSSRSYIVQDDMVPWASANPPGSTWARERRIDGLSVDWMQFRFQQGCPDKERRFDNVVQDLKEEMKMWQYCSLFGWHGSPIENWHSIIREGLDFRDTAHGRSFGHGVYFSQDLGTSIGYTRNRYDPADLPSWGNSVLRPASAVSLCELVNNPMKFTRYVPYLVVPQRDWIQCRYLLVKVSPTADAQSQPLPNPICSGKPGYMPQDGHRPIRDGRRILSIPYVRTMNQETTRARPRQVDNEEAIIRALSRCGISDDDYRNSPVTPKKRPHRSSSPPSSHPRKKANLGGRVQRRSGASYRETTGSNGLYAWPLE